MNIRHKGQVFFFGPSVLVLMLISLFPFLYGVFLSLTKTSIAKVGNFIGLTNYANLLTDTRFYNALGLSLFFVVGATFTQLVLGFILALLLDRETLLAKTARLLMTLPMMMTPIVVGIAWRLLYDTDYGLINYLLGVIKLGPVPWLASPSMVMFSLILVDTWQWTPFMMLTILAGLFKTLPIESYEAASIDGASSLAMFRYITLPLLTPVILVAVLVRTMDAFKSFDIFFATTMGGPGTSSEIVSLLAYKMGFRFSHMGYAATIVILLLIVTIVISNIYIRTVDKVGTSI